MERSRANFTQVRHSALEIFFTGGRIEAPWVFYKKVILENFAKFAEKRLRQSLFLTKL